MRHMRSRRILAMLLALSMIFGLLTTTAFADNEVDQNPSNVGESAANGTSAGDSGEGQPSGASEDESSTETNKEDVLPEEETIPEEKKTTSDEEVDTQEGEVKTPVEETTYVASIGEQGYASLDAAIQAATEDATITLAENASVYLTSGIAHEGNKSRTVTIQGDGTQTIDIATYAVEAEGATHLNYQRGSKLTFNNVKIVSGENTYDGIVCSELAYNDCTITGVTTLYGAASFMGCTFENTMENQYSIWTWGGTDVEINGCTFNTNGKAILLYGRATEENPTNLTVSGTTFNDRTNGAAGKAAIEIGNDYNATYTLNVTNSTVASGFAEGKNTNSKLWANKNSMAAENLTVEKDGELLYGKKETTGVAKVGNETFDTLEEAFTALNSTNYTLELLDENAWTGENVYWAAGEQKGYAATLAAALTAAYKANAGDITIICRPSADVGTMTHGHVADNITIYGNKAYISGGECDLEVDTYKFSRETGKQDNDNGEYLTGDITITAYALDNLGVWGQRHTENAVTINLTDCDSTEGTTAQRVYITNDANPNGKIDITLTDCDFKTNNTSVYSNADGDIKITNCTFTGTKVPVNFNHKAGGEQTLRVSNCEFNACGDKGEWATFAAPVRFVNSGSGTQSATVDTCTFTDTVGNNGDILIGDGRTGEKSNDVSLTVTNTTANVMAQQPGYYANDGKTDNALKGEKALTTGETLTVSKMEDLIGGSTGIKGSSAENAYTLKELGAMTRAEYIAAQTALGGTMYVTVGDYSYGTDGVLGNGKRDDTPGQREDRSVLNGYNSNGYLGTNNDGANGLNIVFVNGSITSGVTGYESIDKIGTSLLLAVPAYTNVTFKGITFNNVMSFNYQLYTSPWSQLGELKFDGCKFNGIIVGHIAAQTLTFNGCEFTNYTNSDSANNSNPTWIRPAYGNWTENDNDVQGQNFKSLTTINFTDNKVTSTRPVKFERISQWDKTATIKVDGNTFNMTDDGSQKNVGMYLGAFSDETEFNLKLGTNSKGNTTAAIFALPKGKTSLPVGSTVTDLENNPTSTDDAVTWHTENKITLKTEPVSTETSIDLDKFLTWAAANGWNVDGSNYTDNTSAVQGGKLVVKWSPVSGCYDTREHTCTAGNVTATGNTPKRVNNSLTQFQILEGKDTAVTVKNVKFVYEPAAFTVCENSDWKGTFTAEQAPAGQLYFMTTGDVTFESCDFDKVVLTTFNTTGTSTVTNCNFANVYNNYAIKDIRGANVSVTGTTITNCGGGIMVSSTNAVNKVTLTGNTFKDVDVEGTAAADKVGTRAILQFASSGDYAKAALDFSSNTATNCGPVVRQLNKTAITGVEAHKETLEKLGTLYTSDSVKAPVVKNVAKVGETEYATLKEAITNAEAGQTVTLIADVIQNSQLSIDKSLTLDLAGHKIYNTKDIWSDNANSILSIKNGAAVTITGNGTVDAKENDCYTINVVNGELTIENGTFYGNVSVVQVAQGKLTVNGGSFALRQKWPGKHYLFNCIDDAYKENTANVEIYGGTFDDFDPNVAPEAAVDGKTPSFAAPGVGIEKNADGTFTAKTGMVAQVLDADDSSVMPYASLADAIAAAEAGQTVRLLTNAAEDVTINKNITLDLGGKTLTNTNAGHATITIAKDATATVKNGSVVGGTSYYNIQNNGTATFEGLTATAGNTGSSMIDNWGTLTIESGTYTGGLNVVKSEEGSKLTINGGKFTLDYATSGYTGVIFAYGDTTITGGEFIQNVTSTGRWNHPQVILTGVVEGHRAITKVTGGTFTNKRSGEAIFWGVGKATSDNFEVSGGTFNKSIPEGYCADGFIPTKNADGTYGVKEGKFVAKIGSTGYETLTAAIAKATGKTKPVTLVADVTESIEIAESKTCKIDLNGFTLTNTEGSHTIVNNGTLTIKDSSAAKSGTVDNVTNARAAIVNYGTMTLAGGTYTRSKEDPDNNKDSGGKNSFYTILNDKGGSLTIEDGVMVTNVGHFSSMIRNGGDAEAQKESILIIKGGNFSGGINTVKNDEFGKLTISGGSFSNTTQCVVMNWNEASITGGTFELASGVNSTLLFSVAWSDHAIGKMTISGGTFKYTETQGLVQDTYNNGEFTGTLAVSGGTFAHAVEPKYCAEGFEPVTTPNYDGFYEVKAVEGDAELLNADGSRVKYGYANQLATDTDAQGKTIKLFKDTTNGGFMLPAGVTLDLNGKTMTSSFLFATGNVIDSADGTGKLVVAKELVQFQKNDTYLPLYNKAENAYQFFKYSFLTYSANLVPNTNNDKLQIVMQLIFENKAAYDILVQDPDGIHGIKLGFSLSWGDLVSISQTWEIRMPSEQIPPIYKGQANPAKRGIALTIIGLNQLPTSVTTFNTEAVLAAGCWPNSISVSGGLKTTTLN